MEREREDAFDADAAVADPAFARQARAIMNQAQRALAMSENALFVRYDTQMRIPVEMLAYIAQLPNVVMFAEQPWLAGCYAAANLAFKAYLERTSRVPIEAYDLEFNFFMTVRALQVAFARNRASVSVIKVRGGCCTFRRCPHVAYIGCCIDAFASVPRPRAS